MRHPIGFETESLILREFTHEDHRNLYTLTRQKEITDVLPDWDMSEEELAGFLEFVTSSYDNFNEDDVRILLAMQHREDARLIGWCGVFPNDLLLESDREIAYAISKDYRNKGYTTEAVKGMVDYVFGRSSLQEIVAIVKPFNVSSKRVIEKAGFTHRRLTTLTDQCEYDYFSVEKA